MEAQPRARHRPRRGSHRRRPERKEPPPPAAKQPARQPSDCTVLASVPSLASTASTDSLAEEELEGAEAQLSDQELAALRACLTISSLRHPAPAPAAEPQSLAGLCLNIALFNGDADLQVRPWWVVRGRWPQGPSLAARRRLA